MVIEGSSECLNAALARRCCAAAGASYNRLRCEVRIENLWLRKPDKSAARLPHAHGRAGRTRRHATARGRPTAARRSGVGGRGRGGAGRPGEVDGRAVRG
eukprot:1006704-Prymnesium_polylepis.1